MDIEKEPPAIEPVSVGERHSIALPIELEEGAPPALMQTAMAVIIGLFAMLLVWANIAQIRELSIAAGEIAPFGSTREVAHLEGGIVDEVLAAPGETVAAGAPLVKLRKHIAGGEYDRAAARRANLTMTAERLLALLEGREPLFLTSTTDDASHVAEQRAIFENAAVQQKALMESLSAQLSSAKSDLVGAEADFASKTDLVKFSKEQLQIQEELIDEGFTSKQAFLEAKAAYTSAQAAAAAAKARREQAARAVESARAEIANAEAGFKTRLAEERAEAMAALAELEEPINSLQDRTERLTIRSPISGVVKSIAVDGPGDVVRPGGLIAEVTPSDGELFAEVRVEPKDIGHIKIGQQTDVMITAFDPNRYGKISGRITHISADTFLDEATRDIYYVAYVSLDRGHRSDRLLEMLSPGMEVRAEIITKSRSLMRYLLKPVLRPLDTAFTER